MIFAVAFIGLVLYLAPLNSKVNRVGEIAFFLGLAAILYAHSR